MQEIEYQMKLIARYIMNCNDKNLLQYYKGVLSGLEMAKEIIEERTYKK